MGFNLELLSKEAGRLNVVSIMTSGADAEITPARSSLFERVVTGLVSAELQTLNSRSRSSVVCGLLDSQVPNKPQGGRPQ